VSRPLIYAAIVAVLLGVRLYWSREKAAKSARIVIPAARPARPAQP